MKKNLSERITTKLYPAKECERHKLIFFFFSLQATQSNIYGWAFSQKELAAKRR